MRLLACLALLLAALPAWPQIERGEPLPRKSALGAALGPATAEGVPIVRVVPGLTAESVGVKPGDVVTSLGGQPVRSSAAIVEFFRTRVAGDPIAMEVMRDGKKVALNGKLAPRPKQKAEGFDVLYDQVVSKGKRIRVIVTSPKGKGPFPTIFMIGGIGAYSMDGEFASTPYGNILEPIAKTGYAIVRVDKPGQGDSEGPAYTDLLFDDELDAYVQALRLVKTLPVIDKDRIAIFGHSMGGAFGPLVAAQEPVRAVAAAATMSKTWPEYMLENTRRQQFLGGQSPAELDAFMRPFARVVSDLFVAGKSLEQIKKDTPDLAPVVGAISPDGKTFSGVGIPFFQQLATKNLPEAWLKAGAPVLMLWGENDFVSTEWDHQYVVDIVNAARPGTATYAKLPESDHGFFKTTSFRNSLENWGKGGTFNPNVVPVLQAWLDKQLKP